MNIDRALIVAINRAMFFCYKNQKPFLQSVKPWDRLLTFFFTQILTWDVFCLVFEHAVYSENRISPSGVRKYVEICWKMTFYKTFSTIQNCREILPYSIQIFKSLEYRYLPTPIRKKLGNTQSVGNETWSGYVMNPNYAPHDVIMTSQGRHYTKK